MSTFDVQTLVQCLRVGGPRACPVKKDSERKNRVVFSVRETDIEADRGVSSVWMTELPPSGSSGSSVVTRRLTNAAAGTSSDTSPRWSHDGEFIYFLSSRKAASGDQKKVAGNQVWRIAVGKEASCCEPERVTELPLDVDDFLLSPDGRMLLVAAGVFPALRDGDALAATREKLDADKERKASGMIYEQLFVRHWDTWSDGRRNHVFALPLVDGMVGGETPVDITAGLDADVPSKPFGGLDECVAFTPDNQSVVLAARNVGREEAWSTRFDLFTSPLDGSAAPALLEGAGNGATLMEMVFSPDGKTLAYLSMRRPGFEADRFYIMLRNWETGQTRTLAEDWDFSADGLCWTEDSANILTHADCCGQHSLFSISVESDVATKIVDQGTVRGPVAVCGSEAVFCHDSLQSPAELCAVTLGEPGKLRTLTSFNKRLLSQVDLGAAEQFSFEGADGDRVYGYCVFPSGFDPSKKYPVAFLIHGGPQGSMGNDWHYRWNPQIYSGAGFGVVSIDFHGSTGYGQKFTDSISGDWGGKPLVDLQKGLDAALGRYTWMDDNHVAGLGASYGGTQITAPLSFCLLSFRWT
jgi:dipeptidyl aminopeptidase/acylaminoacyl peptidase